MGVTELRLTTDEYIELRLLASDYDCEDLLHISICNVLGGTVELKLRKQNVA